MKTSLKAKDLLAPLLLWALVLTGCVFGQGGVAKRPAITVQR